MKVIQVLQYSVVCDADDDIVEAVEAHPAVQCALCLSDNVVTDSMLMSSAMGRERRRRVKDGPNQGF